MAVNSAFAKAHYRAEIRAVRKRGLLILPFLAATVAVPAWSALQGGRADLVEASLSKPPPAARPNVQFTAFDAVRNRGSATARRSTTTYYLSRDRIRSSNDSLVGSRSVPALRAGKSSRGQATLVTRVPTVPGTYYVIVCADARRAVREGSERNNCRASTTAIFIRERGIKPPPPPPPAAPPK
jgi:hypothetical protein